LKKKLKNEGKLKMEISIALAIFLFIFAGIGILVILLFLGMVLNSGQSSENREIKYLELNDNFVSSCKELAFYLFNIEKEKVIVRGIDNLIEINKSAIYSYLYGHYTIELSYQDKIEDKEEILLRFYVNKKDIVKY